MQQLPARANYINITGDGKKVVVALNNGLIQWYDIQGGDINRKFLITGIVPGNDADKAGLKEGDIIIAINGKKFNSDKEQSQYIKNKGTYTFTILRNGKYLNIKVKKTENIFGFRNTYYGRNRLLLSLFIKPIDKKWIIYTPTGYFNASPGAENFVGWHVNQGLYKEAKFYPLRQFYEKYYTSNLGARLWSGEDFLSDNFINNMELPPEV